MQTLSLELDALQVKSMIGMAHFYPHWTRLKRNNTLNLSLLVPKDVGIPPIQRCKPTFLQLSQLTQGTNRTDHSAQ